MIEIFLNQFKQLANAERSNETYLKYGRITAYNPTSYTVRVMLYPEEIETGWLPIGTIWAGNGWGIYCGPLIDMPCKVSFQEGDLDNAIVDCYVNLGAFRPIGGINSGELLLQHSSGSYIKFHNNGNISIHANAALEVTSPTVTVTGGNVTITGSSVNLGEDTETFRKVMAESAIPIYNSHTHNDNGDPPNQLMSDSDLSNITKVN